MGHVRSAIAGAGLVAVGLAAVGGCAPRSERAPRHHGDVSATARVPAPAAEFLVASGDSTFWVTSDARGIRLRGSPLMLARVAGRFYELYVADDDRSYYDAVFTGQRVYRRDLERGDSMAVFEDTAVEAAAREYAVTHPNETPLDSDEDAADDPSTSVTGDVDLLDADGPFLSFEYHGARGGHAAADTTQSVESVRRGVVDLRAGTTATVPAIFGSAAGDSIVRLGRRAYDAAIDSIRVRGRWTDGRARMASRSVSDFVFEPVSFTLTDMDRELAVLFFVPGRGQQGGRSLGLPPVRGPAPPWWAEERVLLPARGTGPDSTADIWRRPSVSVVARYDSTGVARLALRDAARREWAVGQFPAPVRRVIWLDDPTIDAAMRRALLRAFDESALYSDDARAASHRVRSTRPSVRFARLVRPPGRRRRRRRA